MKSDPRTLLTIWLCLAVAPITFGATTQKTTAYEAENAAIVGGTIRTWGSGYSGTGAVSLPNTSGDSIEWTVSSDHAGPGELVFRYALGGSDRPLEVRVNGQVVSPSFSFIPNAWDRWSTSGSLPVTLNAGNNTVRVTTIGSRGPDMDYLRVKETIPLSGEIMTVYDGANLTGTSATVESTHVVYSGATVPGGLDNQISSFVLSQGYMAVIADPADGVNPSKVYIAADGPLTVNTLPSEFDNAISFLRVVPWENVGKKGFCGGEDTYRAKFDHAWYYDWTKGVERGQRATGPEYVPMCWDERFVQIGDFLAQDQVSHLLSFNEPDGVNQANMPDIVAAVALHKELQKAGLRLGSPACEEQDAFGAAGKWLPDFMSEANAQGARVDYINVHWYDWGNNPGVNTHPNPVDVANRLKAYLANVYAHHRKPIWITEFNANPARPRTVQDGFLQEIMPYLDDCGYVERYAYYQWPAEAGKTMHFVEPTDGSLTTTGQIYNDHQSPVAYNPQELPPQWQSADIGTGNAGATIYNGNFTISGSGAGITGTADGCRYVYQPVNGDATVTALVRGQIWRHNETSAGVMIRKDLTAGAPRASMALSWSNGARFRTRSTAGGGTTTVTQGGIPKDPYWVRLARKDDTFTGYTSPDGIHWTQVGSTTIAMGANVQVGLAVTSNNDGSFNDAIFKHVSVTETLGQSLYADWTRNAFSNPFTDTPITGNPDNDSFTNLQEFAFGMDPTLASTQQLSFAAGGDITQAGPPKLMDFAAQGGEPEYRAVFLRRKDHVAAGLQYTVEFSADLSQWTSSDTTPSLLTDPQGSGGMEAVSVPYPPTVPAKEGAENLAPRFFRVGVGMP